MANGVLIAEPGVPITVIPAVAFVSTVEVAGSTIAVPATSTALRMAVNRIAIPASLANVMRCRAELSLDGGVTWSPAPDGRLVWPWGSFPIAFSAGAGASLGAQSSVAIEVPQLGNANRQVRCFFTPLILLTAGVDMVCN